MKNSRPHPAITLVNYGVIQKAVNARQVLMKVILNSVQNNDEQNIPDKKNG